MSHPPIERDMSQRTKSSMQNVNVNANTVVQPQETHIQTSDPRHTKADVLGSQSRISRPAVSCHAARRPSSTTSQVGNVKSSVPSSTTSSITTASAGELYLIPTSVTVNMPVRPALTSLTTTKKNIPVASVIANNSIAANGRDVLVAKSSQDSNVDGVDMLQSQPPSIGDTDTPTPTNTPQPGFMPHPPMMPPSEPAMMPIPLQGQMMLPTSQAMLLHSQLMQQNPQLIQQNLPPSLQNLPPNIQKNTPPNMQQTPSANMQNVSASMQQNGQALLPLPLPQVSHTQLQTFPVINSPPPPPHSSKSCTPTPTATPPPLPQFPPPPPTPPGSCSHCGCTKGHCTNSSSSSGNFIYNMGFFPPAQIANTIFPGFPAFMPPHGTNGFIHPMPFPHGLPNGINPELLYNNHGMNHGHVPPLMKQQSVSNMQFFSGNNNGNGGGQDFKGKPLTCYNCGGVGHRAIDCKELSMEEITKQGWCYSRTVC